MPTSRPRYNISSKGVVLPSDAITRRWVLRIGVARIFDWGGPKPQLICNDVIKNFQKRKFLWGKVIVEWKI